MEGRQRKLALAGLAAFLISAAAPAEEGAATGRLTLNGETVSLRYAYALAQPGFFDKSAEDVRVLLSDEPLAESALHDVFELTHLGRDGRAHVVEVLIDAERKPIGGAIYARPFDGMVSMAGMHRFDPQRIERAVIAGRLFTEGAHDFAGVSFGYEATFSAAIPRPPSAEDVAAALASPPARAATAWLAAIRAGRQEGVLDLLVPGGAESWRGAEGKARLARLQSETPPDSRVVGLACPTPASAVATINGTRASDGVIVESTIELALVAGAWKVSSR